MTNFIPYYIDDFYSEVARQNPDWEIVVLADTTSMDNLNQFSETSNYRVIDLPLFTLGRINYRIGIFRILIKEKPNVFVVYANPRDLSSFISLLFGSVLRIKTAAFGMFHKIGQLTFFTRLAYRLFYLLSDFVLVYSRKGATVLYAIGLNQKKVIIVGNAIDENKIKQFKKYKKEKKTVPKNFSNTKAKVVLQVVRLSKIKNPILLIDAAKFVIDADPEVKFIIVGLGEEYKRFSERVIELGLEKNFSMLGAVYDEDELSKLFTMARVSVVPTCIGLSLHHSFAYSLPIVTDDSIETQTSEFDIVLNGVNALVYEAGNPKALADCLIKILSDDELHKRLSEGALQTIINGNGIADKANRFSKLFI